MGGQANAPARDQDRVAQRQAAIHLGRQEQLQIVDPPPDSPRVTRRPRVAQQRRRTVGGVVAGELLDIEDTRSALSAGDRLSGECRSGVRGAQQRRLATCPGHQVEITVAVEGDLRRCRAERSARQTSRRRPSGDAEGGCSPSAVAPRLHAATGQRKWPVLGIEVNLILDRVVGQVPELPVLVAVGPQPDRRLSGVARMWHTLAFPAAGTV